MIEVKSGWEFGNYLFLAVIGLWGGYSLWWIELPPEGWLLSLSSSWILTLFYNKPLYFQYWDLAIRNGMRSLSLPPRFVCVTAPVVLKLWRLPASLSSFGIKGVYLRRQASKKCFLKTNSSVWNTQFYIVMIGPVPLLYYRSQTA